MDPDLREGLWSPCDVPANINSILHDFQKLIPNLDSSFLNDKVFNHGIEIHCKENGINMNDLWFLENTEKEW